MSAADEFTHIRNERIDDDSGVGGNSRSVVEQMTVEGEYSEREEEEMTAKMTEIRFTLAVPESLSSEDDNNAGIQ